MRRWWVAIVVVVSLMPGVCVAVTDAAQRDLFRATLDRIHAGDDPGSRALGGYVLEPYVEYFYLSQDLSRVSSKRVRRFLQEQADLPAARRLRSAWLMHLGRAGRWAEYLTFWEPSRDTWLRCYHVTARIKTARRPDASVVSDALTLWSVGQSQPKACDPAFKFLEKRGELNAERRFQRAMLAIDAGNASLASHIARKLRASHRAVIDRGVAALQRPAKTLRTADRWQETPEHQRIVAASLSILARKDSEAANQVWRRLRRHWSWDVDVKTHLDRYVALLSATDFSSDSLRRLRSLSDAATDQSIHEWSVRVALFHEDWSAVIRSIADMPTNLRVKDRWQYWKARALEAKGNASEAERLFRDISLKTNYYGFLAADRLQQAYSICPIQQRPNESTVDQLEGNAPFARAIELFRVDEIELARAEWRLARRELSAAQQRSAALYAHAIGWHDQAIMGLGGSSSRRHYDARFPLGYQSQVTSASQRRSLEPALVYGIMRSESAFAADAVSRAGAIGLMQLMPATAVRVARAERLPYGGKQDLLNPARNIELGTAYLESLAARFDGHPLLVAAAYNAGPEAVERWLSRRHPTEPDIWIETLSYRETREYVSKVIAFSAIYDWRLTGEFRRLTDRMRSIPAHQSRFVVATCAATDAA